MNMHCLVKCINVMLMLGKGFVKSISLAFKRLRFSNIILKEKLQSGNSEDFCESLISGD